MRKLILVLVTVFITASLSTVAQSKLGFGMKGGINMAGQSTSGEGLNVNVENIMRLHAGFYVNYFIKDYLAIQPELLVSGKGSKWDDPYYDTKDLLTYIDIPILIKVQPVKFLNVHAGPQFGYLISALQKDIEENEKTDIKEWYNAADLGLVIGSEVNLPYKLSLTLRYVLGLMSASNDVEYIDHWKNNFFQVSIGYRIKGS